eukprot:TRINITY_DN13299_c0_g1_i1.p1 TRINITY_DN13299_c0_g1~~TRINITY_DN13299_c0_g1_i1.p1  ORF type:complete len:126 (-),score=13.80 TRINITY_DN13299_c0_g1_i1:268-645(-)
MEYHPVFHKFKPAATSDSLTRSLSSSKFKRYPAQHDFGAWGSSTTLAQIKQNEREKHSTFYQRTVAPHVVERLPRARSISNFPGFDPVRDKNYFDRPKSAIAKPEPLQWPPRTMRTTQVLNSAAK